MLRKLLGKDSESLSAAEEVALARLAAAHRRLLMDGGRVNTKSEAGLNACAVFLDALETAGRTMRLDAAPRTYRVSFTINYRALFPNEARNYRVDVLEASVEQYAVIWVNGDKFEFSAEAMRRAEDLQYAWSEVGVMLQRWSHASDTHRSFTRPGRSELRNALVKLDFAWASFEQRYITELIDIEEKARKLIVQAIEHERGLQLLEAKHGDNEDALQRLPEYRDEQQRLVGCIARLNSVANVRRKGRDDLGVDVLFDAVATLRRCDASEGGESTEALSAARILATDVVESFVAMRDYLREVERCLERVDPHLCNNAGLVERLVDWEESWEVGTRYIQSEKLLAAVCDLVAEIRVAQRLAPALTTMCDDCDVELFLVLPRILWLRFLARPTNIAELLKTLLPHRFAESKVNSSLDSVSSWDAELEGFIGKFRHTTKQLASARSSGVAPGASAADAAEQLARELLVKRVVSGAAGKEDDYNCLAPGRRGSAETTVEELMRELERWSIELQRHCPEDWNQCSAVLVQCLTGGGPKPKPGPFHV